MNSSYYMQGIQLDKMQKVIKKELEQCFSMEKKTNAMMELFKIIFSALQNKWIGKYFISPCTRIWDNSIKLHLVVQDRFQFFYN